MLSEKKSNLLLVRAKAIKFFNFPIESGSFLIKFCFRDKISNVSSFPIDSDISLNLFPERCKNSNLWSSYNSSGISEISLWLRIKEKRFLNLLIDFGITLIKLCSALNCIKWSKFSIMGLRSVNLLWLILIYSKFLSEKTCFGNAFRLLFDKLIFLKDSNLEKEGGNFLIAQFSKSNRFRCFRSEIVSGIVIVTL